MLIRTFAVLALLSALPLAQGTFRPRGEADFWQGSGVDLAFARRFISNEFCYTEGLRLESCKSAFEVVQAALNLESGEPLKALRGANLKNRAFDFDGALNLIDQKIMKFPKEMVFGRMINAELRFFDAHALVIPIEYLRESVGSSSREYLGVGLETEITGAGVFVRRVLEASSARQAGLRLHDRLVRIQGRSVGSAPEAQAVLSLLSERRGEKIDLVIERDGQQLSLSLVTTVLIRRDLEVERASIGKSAGWVLRLNGFSEGLCASMATVLNRAHEQGVSWLLLDVRNNSGGLLSEALCVASLFVGERAQINREVVSQTIPSEFGLRLRDLPLEEASYTVRAQPLVADIPLVILTSAKSKSAAEVIAAILQDQSRAWVVGERTFGKGTTQRVNPVTFNSNLRVSYTFTRYRRADGSSFQLEGVKPNFEVPFRLGATPLERMFWREAEVEGRAVVPGLATSWQERREAQVRKIKSCIESRKADERLSRATTRGDYQMAYGFAVLHCR